MYRPINGTWYILGSTTGFQATAWGSGSDIPVPGDFDGDGRTDVAIFRPSTGVWWVLGSSSGPGAGVTWGAATDLPILQR